MTDFIKTNPMLTALSAFVIGLAISIIGDMAGPIASFVLGFGYGFAISRLSGGIKPMFGQLVAYLGGIALSIVMSIAAPPLALAIPVLLAAGGYALLRSHSQEA